MSSIMNETIDWGSKELTIETGKIARQADGAVVVKYGATTVLCTVVCAKIPAKDASFFPLTINYQEKFYASGKIPGGFVKREGKPGDREVLISRLIDRPIRPLFPDGFLNDVQIICTTLSYDHECSPDIAALIGASAALSISGIPFLGPIACCRVGYSKKVGFILNPTESSKLDLVVAGTKDGVLMVESEARELPEETMLEAVMFGFEKFQPVIEAIERLKEKVGKQVVKVESFESRYGELLEKIEKLTTDKIKNALGVIDKLERRNALDAAKEEVVATTDDRDKVAAESLFEGVLSMVMRDCLLKTKKRIDGRGLDQIRPITCEIDILPKVHGSALFTRGETQALVVTTLGSSMDEQIIDDIDGEKKQRFLLHYNFPPYSVGEVGRMGAPGRREIGHGKLAWRAINPVIPAKDSFPYTMRVVSDVTESNGSSSMATVCGSSLSMMSAGIPITDHVAGIAMGLIKDKENYVVLSDIMGDEDHLGDMDFKVAGTKGGITALQMDIKITGINREIIQAALEQARKGRMHILEIMSETISSAKDELNENAPRIETISIDKDRIRDLIGPGGKVIRELCAKTNAKIDIDDSGVVSIFAADKKNMDEAIKSVKSICCPPDKGAVFVGHVVKITDFGAFVSIGSREGLVHISNIAHHKIQSVSDVLKVGQEVKVKVIDIDDKNRIKLSMKDVEAAQGGHSHSPRKKF
ncbi:MAG: polyribonucleotide nucleotidyltransferase [Holosporales bacterium]|jgi:polyribonucleotide nucleotidyltransferase|nr:polyribonucleotide nucleotidyltransferase [Holosporales bacterium]